MADIRPELSKKNPYWIDRHRYYELKHFCLQYPIWKQIHRSIDGSAQHPFDTLIFTQTNEIRDPVRRAVEIRETFSERMNLVEDAAMETSPEFADYIFRAVTEGLTYENLRLVHQMPCCREIYYEFYRKFFYILHNSRK